MIPIFSKHLVSELDDSDKPAIIAHLKRLNPNDRYLRFFAVLGDCALEKYVDEVVNFKKSKGYGIFDATKSKLLAFAHISKSVDEDAAEIGISVDADHRGIGLAKDLMSRILVFSKSNKINTLFMSCLRENKAMQSIARQTGMEVVVDHSEAIAKLKLSQTPYEAFMNTSREIAFQNVTIFDKCYRQNAVLLRHLFTGE
jgi:GNAT superfamily N-acetyltransferase